MSFSAGACGKRRYQLDADSPAALRDYGHRDRRRQLEKAVSQNQQALAKVRIHVCCFWTFKSPHNFSAPTNQDAWPPLTDPPTHRLRHTHELLSFLASFHTSCLRRE